jgi:hypothetical protein
MSKLRCVLFLLVLVDPAFAQKLTGRLGNPARPFSITAEIRDEGSFELQRSLGSLTNWVAFTNFNSFPSTNTYGDSRTNLRSFYRLVRLNIPAAITAQPVGATNFAGQEIRLEAAATGSWPLRFQWLKDGQPVEGANSNKLVLSGLVAQSGSYHLVVSNLWGAALSTATAVKIVNPVATNIAGRKIRYVVKGAQGGAIGSGTFDTTYFAAGNYSAVSSNNANLNDQAFWQYGFSTTQPIGRISLINSFLYPNGSVLDLTFTNETSGTYLIQVPNSAARQSGDFTFVP